MFFFHLKTTFFQIGRFVWDVFCFMFAKKSSTKSQIFKVFFPPKKWTNTLRMRRSIGRNYFIRQCNFLDSKLTVQLLEVAVYNYLNFTCSYTRPSPLSLSLSLPHTHTLENQIHLFLYFTSDCHRSSIKRERARERGNICQLCVRVCERGSVCVCVCMQ
jgi:hypothetical protein